MITKQSIHDDFERDFLMDEYEHDQCNDECTKKYWEQCAGKEKLDFIDSSIQSLLEQILPEEQGVNMQWKNGWNNCLTQIKKKIKESGYIIKQ